jgi:hypothetical protein
MHKSKAISYINYANMQSFFLAFGIIVTFAVR